MMWLTASLFCLILATSEGFVSKLEDCDTAGEECCSMAVDHIWTLKLTNVNIDGGCDFYCGTWTCDCPNYEQKFHDISRVLLEREVDKRCQDSRPQPHTSGSTVISGFFCF